MWCYAFCCFFSGFRFWFFDSENVFKNYFNFQHCAEFFRFGFPTYVTHDFYFQLVGSHAWTIAVVTAVVALAALAVVVIVVCRFPVLIFCIWVIVACNQHCSEWLCVDNSECRTDWKGKGTDQEIAVCIPQWVVWESSVAASLCQCWSNGPRSRHYGGNQRFHPYVLCFFTVSV